MARQLKIISPGQVIPTPLHSEVQRSYLEYAMSVIVGRALPDVRDGLKPVHRRILYAMHELGLTPDRPYRKCARVVGDVLGKYHPHGDQAVYDALVRMVQSFSSRYPLLAGHGNFGSVDNDPPAAMRYTETRLSPVGNDALLTEIGEATVDFIDNFDSSQQEPVVLPAQLPFLLLNGSSGIAVGMATNIPPHNLGEVVDGLIALIDRPDLPDEKLLKLIPGPDFPTGGEITGTKGIRDAYLTGRGSIPIRAVTQIEEVPGGRGRHRRTAIIITELPFQVNKAGCIEKIAELVNNGRVEGIADIRDESDREGMRVVIELRRDTSAEAVLNALYRMTPLQSNFGAIMLCLSGGQPQQMSLKQSLSAFLAFREETLTRQYRHELAQAEQRLSVVSGLLVALENLDTVIDILRNSADGTSAKAEMQAELDLNDRQGDAILAMPLRRLTGLERQRLQTEHDELTARIAQLNQLLNDRRELLKALKKELRALKRQFGDERRTRILSAEERAQEKERLAEIEAEVSEDDVILEFTRQGYVRRSSPRAFQRRQTKAEPLSSTLEPVVEDVVIQVTPTTTGRSLLSFTRSGKAFSLEVGDIPATPRNSRGTPIVTLLPPSAQSDGDAEVSAAQLIYPQQAENKDVILLTQQGRIKRLPLSEFSSLTARGLTALKLKVQDSLVDVMIVADDAQLVLATSGGRLLRFDLNEEQIPYTGRTTQGQAGIRLSRRESLVGWALIESASTEDTLLLMTAQGYAKRLRLNQVRLGHRGDLGIQAMPFSVKSDQLVGLCLTGDGAAVRVTTDQDRIAQILVSEAPIRGREEKGRRVVSLAKKEAILALDAVRDEVEMANR
ncbi:MAG: DNA gyrase subunit A [Elainellaceae cyanobacterium]